MIITQFSASFANESTATANGLPKGFVYLHEVEPSIRVDLKYASDDNFTGSKVKGYQGSAVILTKRTAEALKRVQKELLKQGYSLVVYDAYRPKKAAEHFVHWAKQQEDIRKKHEFYPHIEKSDIISHGYIAPKSTHSRGSTVDVTIISVKHELEEARLIKRILVDGTPILHRYDNTVDMGTHFDFFGEASHHGSPQVDDMSNARRNFLKSAMVKQGFNSYDQEWWHYTLAHEPFPDTYFDFDVK